MSQGYLDNKSTESVGHLVMTEDGAITNVSLFNKCYYQCSAYHPWFIHFEFLMTVWNNILWMQLLQVFVFHYLKTFYIYIYMMMQV